MTLLLLGYKYLSIFPSSAGIWKITSVKSFISVAPLGISFLAFESISYLVDIYREDASPGSLFDCALFLSLFPKLLSGPIVLWKDFQPQIKELQGAVIEDTSSGVDLIMLGFAKKAIIADTLAVQINAISSTALAAGIDWETAWLKAILYFFQLYYDFSGYSDIAIGLCRVFGFKVKKNFDVPYTASSVTEFWRRWHVSLGTWFREYVYIPLGGNRRGNVYLNLFVVFLLTGIWHGSNLTFLIWGVAHGVVIVVERLLRNRSWFGKTPKPIAWCFTMVFVFFGWILFSAGNLKDFGNQLVWMFTRYRESPINFGWRYFLSLRTIIILGIAGAGAILPRLLRTENFKKMTESFPALIVKKSLLIGAFVVAILFIVNSTYSPFLYFQF